MALPTLLSVPDLLSPKGACQVFQHSNRLSIDWWTKLKTRFLVYSLFAYVVQVCFGSFGNYQNQSQVQVYFIDSFLMTRNWAYLWWFMSPTSGTTSQTLQKKNKDFSIPFHSSLSITRQPIPRCPKEPCRQAQGIIAIQHIELQCSLRQLQSLRYLGSHVRCRFQVLRPSWFLAIWPASRLHLVTQTISKHPNFEFGDVFKFQFKWLLMITSQSDLQNLEFWGKILAIFCHKHPKNYQKNERFPLNKIRNTCSNTCNTFTS